MDLKSQLIEFEGYRKTAYPDPLTGGDPWTIGVGCAVGVKEGDVWDDARINARLDEDIAKARAGIVSNLPWFDQLNEPRQAVLIGMAFQIGVKGLLEFKRTLAAVRDEHFADAAENMRQSLWAKQTPKRAARLAHQMETGEWS